MLCQWEFVKRKRLFDLGSQERKRDAWCWMRAPQGTDFLGCAESLSGREMFKIGQQNDSMTTFHNSRYPLDGY